MESKKEKKILNKIKAKKIVDNMNVRMVKLNKFKIREDLTEEEYQVALNDFMDLCVRQYTPENNEPLLKAYMKLHTLAVKEFGIETLELKHPELWELSEDLDIKEPINE
jgi:hypothetical protein